MRSDNSDMARAPAVIVAAVIVIAVLASGCSKKDRNDPSKNPGQYITVLTQAKTKSEASVDFFGLRAIGQMLHTYANMYDEKFPPTLQVLVDKGLLAGEHISGKEQELRYIPGQTLMSPLSNVIVYTDQPDARGECYILRVSGQMEKMRPEQAQAAVEATRKLLR